MQSVIYTKLATMCKHTWYMREPGIQCIKCLIVWDKSMDTNSESLDSGDGL